MAGYIITIDTGTTNTRVFLWDEARQLAAFANSGTGVKTSAVDGGNTRLKEAVRDCLQRVLSQAGTDYDSVKMIIASGMITSNVGLVEIPHCKAPAGIKELASALAEVNLPDICPLPVFFVPGVKNNVDPDIENFESMDIMRGEETESMALLEDLPEGRARLLILPGSHMKFVMTDDKKRITGSLTTISGELLEAVTRDTIIADSVNAQLVDPSDYDRDWVLRGAATAKRCGLGRACFTARILSQFVEKDVQHLANFILGAVLAGDVRALLNTSAISPDADTEVIVAGKEPLRRAISDVLWNEGCFQDVTVADPDGAIPLSARGAFLIALERFGKGVIN